MFLHIQRSFSIKPSYIAQRYKTHKKRTDQPLSGATLLRMTLFLNAVFNRLNSILSNMPFLLASNCDFVLDAYRLNKSPMNFN